MNILFAPHLRKFVIVFFDDIPVFSRSLQNHLTHLKLIFQLLLDNQFYLKKSKCSFAQTYIAYLGHIISSKGVGLDSEKVKAMLNWPPPKTNKQLRGFLGLTSFYRNFVRNNASIAAPLTELLKKDGFIWNEAAQQSFEQLKQAMTEAPPVLRLHNFEEDFVLETDPYSLGMGAVLCQQARSSHMLLQQEILPQVSDSIYLCSKVMCHYLYDQKMAYISILGKKFVIHTDQRILRELMTQIV